MRDRWSGYILTWDRLYAGRAASGSDDKTARFWDVVSGRQEAVLRGHETVVRAVCFDGAWVISGDDAGCVQVWSAERHEVETVWHARSRCVMVLQVPAGWGLGRGRRAGGGGGGWCMMLPLLLGRDVTTGVSKTWLYTV